MIGSLDSIMVRHRVNFFTGVLLAVLPAMAIAEPVPNAKMILRRADAATKAVKAFSYSAEFHGEGDLANRLPRVRGTVIGRHRPRPPLDRLLGGGRGSAGEYTNFKHFLRFRGEILLPDDESGKAFDIAIDAKRVVSIDVDQKLMIQAPFLAGKELIQPGRQLFMIEYLHEIPFRDEIRARQSSHEGVKTIGGVECDDILVLYRNGSRARWFFGREDHLPRRVDRLYDQPNLKGKTVLTLTDLNTHPRFKAATFDPPCPEGFKMRTLRKRDTPRLLPIGEKAPNWKLKTPEGKIVRLDELRGNVVVMDFWATWCGFCKMSMKDVQSLHEKFKDQHVRVLGISCWDDGDPAAYMKSKGYTYTTLLKGDRVAEMYKLSGLPTFYVIDPKGRIAYARSGLKREQELTKVVSKVLDKSLDGP